MAFDQFFEVGRNGRCGSFLALLNKWLATVCFPAKYFWRIPTGNYTNTCRLSPVRSIIPIGYWLNKLDSEFPIEHWKYVIGAVMDNNKSWEGPNVFESVGDFAWSANVLALEMPIGRALEMLIYVSLIF